MAENTPKKKTGPVAHFNVEQAEKDYEKGLDHVEPFTVGLHEGKVVTFKDPRVLGWQTISSFDISNAFGVLREITSTKEDFKAFVDHDFPGRVLNDMMEQYFEHYGIDPGNFRG